MSHRSLIICLSIFFLKDQPMWIAGAYGNSDVYLTDLSNITAGGLDTLTFKRVIILRETTKHNSKKPWHKVLQGTFN